MIVTEDVGRIRTARWADPSLSWGLVPTMGYLHDGHLSLVKRARTENDRVAVSIFINPTQFAPDEDLTTYPRDQERDLALLAEERVNLIFVPRSESMYPPGFQTKVSVEALTELLEGVSRPTHFQGVTTVVAKLLNIIQPTKAYFGQKDAQQAIVVRRMVRDLDFDVEVVTCPIVREADGLAMSSRNINLSAEQRQAAPVLHRALSLASQLVMDGERDAAVLRQILQETVEAEPLATIDYVSAANPETLRELDQLNDSVLLSMAVSFGSVRLIDNMLLQNLGNQTAADREDY